MVLGGLPDARGMIEMNACSRRWWGMTTKTTLVVPPLLATALALSACSAVMDNSGTTPPPSATTLPTSTEFNLLVAEAENGVHVVVLAASSPASSNSQGRMAGELTTLDGCLVLDLVQDVGGGAGVTVPLWPNGTEVLTDSVGVRLSDGRVFKEGDYLVTDGGERQMDEQVSNACSGVQNTWAVNTVGND